MLTPLTAHAGGVVWAIKRCSSIIINLIVIVLNAQKIIGGKGASGSKPCKSENSEWGFLVGLQHSTLASNIAGPSTNKQAGMKYYEHYR
jgi:hypothetical protein